MRTPTTPVFRRFRLALRWRIGFSYLFSALVFVSLAYLLQKTWSEGVDRQLANASVSAHAACDKIRQRFTAGVEGNALDATLTVDFQNAVLEIILDQFDGVEGGFWDEAKGFRGYAFPTYDGASAKKDVPKSETAVLSRLSKSAIAADDSRQSVWEGRREAVFSVACPVRTRTFRGAAWTMMRVPTLSGNEFDHLKWLVGALLVLVALHGIASARLLYDWVKDLGTLRTTIQNHPVDDLPALPASREPDLQPIVHAFNELNTRLGETRASQAELSRKLGQAERLTLLGRMAAGIAHEIRNPMATLRIKLENVAVDPANRFGPASSVCQAQIDRVDRLVQMLLAMTRPFELEMETVELRAWFQTSFATVFASAAERNVDVVSDFAIGSWRFDPFNLGRALENVLQNAVAFAPPDSRVTVGARELERRLVIEVQDQGPGIKESERASLFEPFVSGRENGTGLGLVLAKEIVEAHGGTLTEIGDSRGARFRMEIPWPKS